jgi:uncharacterized protein YfkK (UPF0435 family)
MHSRFQRYWFLSLIVFLLSCGNSRTTAVVSEKDTLSVPLNDGTADSTHLKYNHLIGNVPIPFDILRRLSSSYVVYKAELLNPVGSVAGYNQTDSKSLNLGVYGADLTYIISVGEFKEFASHIHTIKRLADELGIPTAFDDNMMSRYNLNETNKDTLQNVMFHSYTEIDKTLKSNDRLGMAALVVCGGWIESVYLTTQTIGNNDNSGSYSELYRLLFEQKKHLENLTSLLNDFKTEPFESIRSDLEKLEKLYLTVADGNHMSREEVKKIAEKIARLRLKITHGS